MAITRKDLLGYIERDLDADLARWFADRPRAVVDEAEVRPVEPFLARLAPDDAAALAAYDRRVRAGGLPDILDIADWSYGFDFAADDCGVLDSDYSTEVPSDEVYTVGADGGGNYYTVLTDGQVAVWFHEEGVLEGGTRFDDLDTFVWSLVRYHAVRAGVLDPAEVIADFQALGQDGAVAPEVGLLASMRPRQGAGSRITPSCGAPSSPAATASSRPAPTLPPDPVSRPRAAGSAPGSAAHR
ncbi:hypothetical protein [Nocardia jiangsuensis]|uniref:SUKH-4 immunity protein of toxin-antitoxin system n=1 Tax=Nocardia jiangsuensis TaxID=1691563 RepID=A0ABV8DST0_9NOCA